MVQTSLIPSKPARLPSYTPFSRSSSHPGTYDPTYSAGPASSLSAVQPFLPVRLSSRDSCPFGCAIQLQLTVQAMSTKTILLVCDKVSEKIIRLIQPTQLRHMYLGEGQMNKKIGKVFFCWGGHISLKLSLPLLGWEEGW